MSGGRDELARQALARIPLILTLQDRNPHSATYGCFDRNYWQYRMLDFPSGMSQEFVYPLALVHELPIPGNPYRGSGAIREWAVAGIHFAARSAHPDGSCDDYFPYERAMGAAAFSLLACVEAARLLEIRDDVTLAFLRRRADWLASHDEAGRLANHHALAVLGLTLTGRLLDTTRWHAAATRRLHTLLEWQHDEGWFPEYDGCDPGYHTLTIGCLAALRDSGADLPPVDEAIRRAVALAAELIHPDGSYGGEYGSRNTYNYFPHGFELAGALSPEALGTNDRFVQGLAAGVGACYDDDHLVGHHTWSYLLAWRDWTDARPGPAPRRPGRTVLPGAGLVIERRGDTELYASVRKGGVFKLFRGGVLVESDTGPSLRVRAGGRARTAVTHLDGGSEADTTGDAVEIAGTMAWAKESGMTPVRMIVLRVVMLGFGRFFPNLIRRMLQRMLIVGRRDAPFRFSRRLRWDGSELVVRDEITADDWSGVESAGIGRAQTSVHVVMSRVYQAGQLGPWLDLTARVRGLGRGEPLVVERRL